MENEKKEAFVTLRTTKTMKTRWEDFAWLHRLNTSQLIIKAVEYFIDSNAIVLVGDDE